MASYQLSPFEVGQVKAHMEHGLGCTSIAQRLKKADGKTSFSETAISNSMKKLQENPKWRGEGRRVRSPPQDYREAGQGRREVGGGQPRQDESDREPFEEAVPVPEEAV